jgi:hypothetical protein
LGLEFFETSAKENINIRVSGRLGLEFFEDKCQELQSVH